MAQSLPHPIHPGKMTFEEFIHWGDETSFAEWIDGEVVELPLPTWRHQDQVGFLMALLRTFSEEHRLGEVLSVPFLMRLPVRPSGRRPDIMFVANEHLHRFKEYYLDGPADLIVEISLAETEDWDRNEKLNDYAQSGVREYWLIHSERNQAEFYQLGENNTYRPVSINQVET
ncbi:MAG TPA: Uma2 family endonuclease [Chthonomonadaceae bacterium]|nr:Uma2 family endonuclease [Chthonomonadaceae bacterium]